MIHGIMWNAMDAVILLNKPKGMTSFSAVRECRHIFHEKKTGHTGTLDPNASGLLIVLMGKYTKLVPFCVANHKQYHAQFQLGLQTDTEDIWGEVLEEKTPRKHEQAELDQVCQKFIGDIKQVPPMYSAIKVNGQKLYDLARKGVVIEREKRDCHISSLTVRHIEADIYEMDAVVSSGTYIRTLISDYAKALGEIGTMTALERVGIENLKLEQAATFEMLQNGEGLIEPDLVISPEWKRVDVPELEADIKNGKSIALPCEEDQVLLLANGKMLAAYERKEDGRFHCKRGLF